jgi:DNA helicase-2/ATP-dependent DNA helicase PcrA
LDPFEPVRSAAVELHNRVVAAGADASKPLALVNAAVELLDLELVWLAPNASALDGARALFDEQTGTIMASSGGDDGDRAVLVGHEIGHAVLHVGSAACRGSDVDPTQSQEAAPVGLQKVEDYGAHERRELQANVFAREFLLPRRLARERHLAVEGARAVSTATQLPLDLVRQQMFDALLLPPAPPAEESVEAPPPRVDESQDRAVAHRNAPFLLEAGPGTGKTRTLVRRVQSLLDEKVDPASILVLTFSNRAAGELSERLAKASPDAAAQIWIGTFHGFGLDLVRRHHEKLGLAADPPLFDRSDAIAVLEEILPTLALAHYRNLWDPELILREMLTAISRAKDEMVGPTEYRRLAQAMSAASEDDAEALADAEKALEVARVYELYEAALAQNGGVDFGDLVGRPTRLLETDETVRAMVRLRHRHVLVDEYQDINRASARLVRAVAGDGKRLWVVGDARQSIYRFRGASPANMTAFAKDYPGAVIDRLEVNYRSSKEVVDTFVAFAPEMSASTGMLPLQLDARAGPSGVRPELRVFQTPDDEIEGVAAGVKQLEAAGVRLRDQAVLCRSNARLNAIAAGLEARDIPVLHLGSLFEREEVRDLLALLSLTVDPFGSGLVRLAAKPRYAIPLNDVAKLVEALKGSDRPALPALAALCGLAGLSGAGQDGLQRLVEDTRGLEASRSAWTFAADYLLERTGEFRTLAHSDSVAQRMRAVAVWQFLNFVREASPVGSGAPIQRTLDRVRQLVLLSEERDLRQVPAAALHMDAVRLMTVHGSKGLEFEAVHLPGLTVAGFPSTNRGERCPAPRGLIEGAGDEDPKAFAKQSHAAEEQCLFFVALSRARQRLQLYHCSRQPNGSNRNSSPYLTLIRARLDVRASPPQLKARPGREDRHTIHVTLPGDWRLTDARLESYQGCPRRFFYTYVLGLGGQRRLTPFGKAHDCLYEAVRLVSKARAEHKFDQAELDLAFQEIWTRRGPVGHGFEAEYRALCTRLLENLVRGGEGRAFRPPSELTVTFGSGRVLVEPSEVIETADGATVLRRVRTGYRRSDEYDKLAYTLFHLAGEAAFGGRYEVEAHHLTDDQLETVVISERKRETRRDTSERLVAGIASGAFAPDPDAVTCPRCPHFFICAATPAGPLNLN